MLELLDTRSISGKGIIKVPTEKSEYRRYYLVANTLRLPVSQLVDRDYNPQQTFLATLTFIRNDNVIDAKKMQFEAQEWEFLPPYDGQLLIALKCAYQGTLQSFVNLETGLGLPNTQFENAIKNYTYIHNIWDECRVQCYSSAAIQLKLYAEDYESCDVSYKNPAMPPPKPDTPPPPPLPPTMPTDPGNPGGPQTVPAIGDISPPYDSGTSDNGNTAPFSGDLNPPPEPPTQGTPCGTYDVTYTFSQSFNDGTPADVTRTVRVYGKIGQISFNALSGTTRFFLECQGYISGGAGSPADSCGDYALYQVGDNGFGDPPIHVISAAITMVESA